MIHGTINIKKQKCVTRIVIRGNLNGKERCSLQAVVMKYPIMQFLVEVEWANMIFNYSLQRSIFFYWRCGPTRARASSLLRLLDHIQRRTTVGRTPLDEWSARRRDLYLTTHNRQTSRPLWNSNPQSQQARGRRPTPYTTRPVGPAQRKYTKISGEPSSYVSIQLTTVIALTIFSHCLSFVGYDLGIYPSEYGPCSANFWMHKRCAFCWCLKTHA